MAVLLATGPARATRIVARVFGLWYAAVLAVSFAVTPAGLESGTSGRVLAWGLHLEPDHACVMCGLSRSFAAMSHGEWARAMEYNASGPALYVAMLALALWAIVSTARAARVSGLLVRG
jgi:hypothetical protein